MHSREIAQGDNVATSATLTSDGVAVGSNMKGNEVAQNGGSPLAAPDNDNKGQAEDEDQKSSSRQKKWLENSPEDHSYEKLKVLYIGEGDKTHSLRETGCCSVIIWFK